MEMLHTFENVPSLQTKKYHRPAQRNGYEMAAWQVQKVVCGLDEVGRGCLAGPLVAAAVILPPEKIHPLITDSKLMTAQERLEAYLWIIAHCSFGIGIVHHRIIDKHNIWHATIIAMQKAFMHLTINTKTQPSAILVDALPLIIPSPAFAAIPVYHFPKGELLSSSIAAASIVAKVWRDQLVTRMATSFPGYSLDSHKGYATKKHTRSIVDQSFSIIHRLSFLKEFNFSPLKESHETDEQQQRLC